MVQEIISHILSMFVVCWLHFSILLRMIFISLSFELLTNCCSYELHLNQIILMRVKKVAYHFQHLKFAYLTLIMCNYKNPITPCLTNWLPNWLGRRTKEIDILLLDQFSIEFHPFIVHSLTLHIPSSRNVLNFWCWVTRRLKYSKH